MIIVYFLSFLSPILGMAISIGSIINSYIHNGGKIVKYPRGFWIPFAMFFGTFGYCINPLYEVDLTRYFTMLNSYNGVSLIDIILQDQEYLFSRDTLFWVVAQTGDEHILPFISGFIIYGIVFYVFFEELNKLEDGLSGINLIFIVLAIVGAVQPYATIGNVRCILAFAIFTYAVYRETEQNKKNVLTYLLYLVALGMHTSTFILLILRLVLPLIRKFGKVLIFVIALFSSIVYGVYPYISALRTNIIGSYIYHAFNKAYYYYTWTSGWAIEVQNSISNRVTKIYGAIYIVLVLIMYFYETRKKNSNLFEDKMSSFLYSVSLIALGSIGIKMAAFWRFEALFILFCPVYLFRIIKNKSSITNIILKVLFVSFIPITVANLIVQIRNTDALKMFGDFLTFSGVSLFW